MEIISANIYSTYILTQYFNMLIILFSCQIGFSTTVIPPYIYTCTKNIFKYLILANSASTILMQYVVSRSVPRRRELGGGPGDADHRRQPARQDDPAN